MKAPTRWASCQILLFKMRVILTNLSNKLFEESRLLLNASAVEHGITETASYDFEELKGTAFFSDHREILELPRGIGYWLWKPYIILQAMQKLSEGDIVIYSDCGLRITERLDPLLAICAETQPIVLFGNGDNTNSTWTKRDCFILMDCDSRSYWEAPHCDAAFSLFRKSAFTLQFLEEWMGYGSDPRIITDLPNTCGKKNRPEYIHHRWDQSILSLLAQKYKLPLFRMPSQFGNHYKTHPYRVAGEINCINQMEQKPLEYYAVIPYYNSPYYQLLDHHRTRNGQPKIIPPTPWWKKVRIRPRLRSLARTIRIWYYK